MKTSITYRLFGAILMAAGLAVVCLMIIMQWNLDRGFLKFVRETEASGSTQLARTLEQFHTAHGNWELLTEHPDAWHELLVSTFSRHDSKPPAFGPPPKADRPQTNHEPAPGPPPFIQNYEQRFFLYDSNHQLLIGSNPGTADIEETPLAINGETIGFLGHLPIEQLTDNRHLDFLHKQQLTFILVAIIIVIVSAGISLLLARRLIRPLKNMTLATHKLSSGEFSTRVSVNSSDELGQLAADFNLLALTLEKNEQARKQWIADISHELRTPIGILRGEIEALIDGIRQAEPAALHSLHSEVMRLSRLVDDLYQLSMSDLGALTYRKTKIDIVELLGDLIDSYQAEINRHELHFYGITQRHRPIFILADPERLRQLFANLIDNTLKYTEAGGYLKIIINKGSNSVEINIQDSAPAVPPENLERLFDRLYREESSRNRATGGAGLGLAICRNISEAHQGEIAALASPLGGLWIKVTLPLYGGPDAQ